jgi:DoxX-like protein
MIASDPVPASIEGIERGPTRVAGIVCTIVAALFLASDATLKVLRLAPAVNGTTSLGYPADRVVWIGTIELICLVRVSSPLFTHTLFPGYVALLLWGGLYLRDPRLRALARLSR